MAEPSAPAPFPKPRPRHSRVKRLTAGILAVGFVSAAVVYFLAGPETDNPYDPMQNKMFLHDLELYGGKANVLAAEFRDWFTGLWQGRNLAFTIAALTVIVVLVLRFFASLPPEEDDEENVVDFPGPGQ